MLGSSSHRTGVEKDRKTGTTMGRRWKYPRSRACAITAGKVASRVFFGAADELRPKPLRHNREIKIDRALRCDSVAHGRLRGRSFELSEYQGSGEPLLHPLQPRVCASRSATSRMFWAASLGAAARAGSKAPLPADQSAHRRPRACAHPAPAGRLRLDLRRVVPPHLPECLAARTTPPSRSDVSLWGRA